MIFDDFDKISSELTKLSVNESVKLIKLNLNKLGVAHDNFISETDIVVNNEVDKVVEKLQINNFIYKGKIEAPEGEDKSKWIEIIITAKVH